MVKNPKTVSFKTYFFTIILFTALIIISFNIGRAGYVGVETEQWYTPSSPYSYMIGIYNSTHYYMQNHTGHGYTQYYGYDYLSTNASHCVNLAIGNLTTGNIFIKAGITPSTLTLVSHPNIFITGEVGFENAGATATAYNGTWITHGLAGDPGTTGSITLSLRGLNSYNATMILRVPTVTSSNSTHFQIEFYMWETVTWTLVPVTLVEAQTLYWYAAYKL